MSSVDLLSVSPLESKPAGKCTHGMGRLSCAWSALILCRKPLTNGTQHAYNLGQML